MKNKYIYLAWLIMFLFWQHLSFSQIIYTYAGTGISGTSGDGGPATSAQIGGVSGIASDGLGNIYFCDNSHGLIKKVDTNGIISTLAGGGSLMNDSIPASLAKVAQPWGIDADANGNVYFTEVFYNRVRKINTSGIITTVAGIATSSGSFSGDGGLATSANLNSPFDVAVDTAGNIYIADRNNSRIRMVNTSGIINTIAGVSSGGFFGDGGLAINAGLPAPEGVAVDGNGNIYISASQSYRVRKIDNSGIITTIAGTGVQGYSGDGGNATLAELGVPRGLEVDNAGNVYIADQYFSVIRRIDLSGIIQTFAGTTGGYSGDSGLATLAQIKPTDVTVNSSGNVYIADGLNYRVRIVCNNSCVNGLNELDKNMILNIYPNPSSGKLKLLSQNLKDIEHCIIKITDVLGREVLVSTYNGELDMTLFEKGVYFLSLYNKHQLIETMKVIKE